jgi:hypothetical protein
VRQTGKQLLTLSYSGFDPKRSSSWHEPGKPARRSPSTKAFDGPSS